MKKILLVIAFLATLTTGYIAGLTRYAVPLPARTRWYLERAHALEIKK